jgi:mRNA-degrading endonuclease RelE of RelBE toxin-antitoxin system
MDFLIAETFTSSLSKLASDEQKAVKTTAFDLQLNPSNPGHQFHRLDRAKDKNFWSVRVNRDIRIIVHRSDRSLLLCFVAHHDDAYTWAERRKIETHPVTGAAQIVEIRETVVEIPQYVEVPVEADPAPTKPALFAEVGEETLLGFGVPPEWMRDVLAANEDTLFEVAEHLPAEAAEALLELATGGDPASRRAQSPELVSVLREEGVSSDEPSPDPFAHPDARRRFRTIQNEDELAQALDYPWERWTIFLHPSQRELVERDFAGPARVAGSAGTGKTVVALHRAAFLARRDTDARVLLTTFSPTLANALRIKLKRLVRSEPKLAERIDVLDLQAAGERLYRARLGKLELASEDHVRTLLRESMAATENLKFGERFIATEWTEVVDAWQLRSWEEYRDVRRLGRKTRLSEESRRVLWSVFERVLGGLDRQGLITPSRMFHRLAQALAEGRPPYEYAVIDEAQDVSVPQLRFLAALGANRPNALFFAGDLGQRIFQSPFSWLSLGVDIRGRSRRLAINYRTSHQIRSQADRLLGREIADVDGVVEERTGTISVFNGPEPVIREYDSPEEEIEGAAAWLRERIGEGLRPQEISVFVRSDAQLDRAKAAVEAAGLSFQILGRDMETADGKVSVATMHLAKGLEYRAVAVMACDDEVIPLQERIETVTDAADLEEVYNTERHLLYVACTRSRDHLLVTSGGVASEFLEDLVASR